MTGVGSAAGGGGCVCVLVAIDVGMSVGGGSVGNRGGAVMSGEEGSCESGGGAS